MGGSGRSPSALGEVSATSMLSAQAMCSIVYFKERYPYIQNDLGDTSSGVNSGSLMYVALNTLLNLSSHPLFYWKTKTGRGWGQW